MKKFSLGLLVIFAVAVAIVWSVDSKTYGSFAASRIIALARANGISVTLEQPRLSLNTFACSDLGVVLVKPPVFFHSQDAICQINPLRLLAGPQLTCSANLYRGTFNGAFSGTWPGSSGLVSATFSKIDLREHPQLLGLGIQSGTLSGALREGKISSGKLNAGIFEVQLSDFSKPAPTIISAQMLRLPLDISIPAIKGLMVTIKGQLAANHLSIAQGDVAFQFGTMHLTGDVDLNDGGQIYQLNVNSEISLSEEGLKQVGPLLPSLNSPSVTSETRNFRVTINGPIGHPVLVATRI
jgi:hypothetical protein